MRPRFLSRSLFFGVMGLLICALNLEAAVKTPNVVFILADDLGWSDLDCYNGDLVETPHIDALAREGMRFTDFYSASSVCSPTRASILTGQHPARLHMTTWFEATKSSAENHKLLPPPAIGNLPLGTNTISRLFQKKGYLTALVGKWHLGEASHYPEAFGFDVNIGGTHWGAPETFFVPYRGSNTWGDGFRYVPHLEFGSTGEYLTDRLTDESLRIIERVGDQPFFLLLAHHAPHTPIEAKADAVKHFEERVKTDPKLHHRNAAYAAMIQSLDESVGRIVATLKKTGHDRDTLVFFTSDNGGYINHWRKQPVTDNFPLRSGKGALYEGGIRVPLIVRWPEVTRAGSVCGEPVTSTDFFATFAEILGAQPIETDGLSLVPLLKNGFANLSRKGLFFHFPHYYQTTSPVSALREGDWKLLHYYEDDRNELYNLKEDLSEKTNLAASLPEKTALLKSRLEQWLREVNAGLPTVNSNALVRKAK